MMNEFQICVEETKRKLDAKKILLIDVRDPYEHKLARIDGSILMPIKKLPVNLDRIKKLAKDKEIVAYCHHGIRSQFAAEFLRKNGVNARSMAGGIDEWSKEIDRKVRIY